MKLQRWTTAWRADVSCLFQATFSDAEGADEGRLIGALTQKLAAAIDDREVIAFGAIEGGAGMSDLIGAIFFTRLRFEDESQVYMLSPVAVATAHQRRGVGTALIAHGLRDLKAQGVGVVVTYGDPAYYARVGFAPLSERTLQAPMPLSMPQGWLGQSLAGSTISAHRGRPQCVEAFRNPAYW